MRSQCSLQLVSSPDLELSSKTVFAYSRWSILCVGKSTWIGCCRKWDHFGQHGPQRASRRPIFVGRGFRFINRCQVLLRALGTSTISTVWWQDSEKDVVASTEVNRPGAFQPESCVRAAGKTLQQRRGKLDIGVVGVPRSRLADAALRPLGLPRATGVPSLRRPRRSKRRPQCARVP